LKNEECYALGTRFQPNSSAPGLKMLVKYIRPEFS